MALLNLFNVSCLLLFSLELYHMLAHIMILCGFRTLPRKDLVKIRYYFLIDTLTVFISSFILTGRLKWLAVFQIIQHLFYFITWDKSYMAKKIIDWSSLDWFKNKGHKVDLTHIDSYLGTTFDIVVHALMMCAIGELLDMTSLLIAIIISQAALYSIIFNPKFAWSSPAKMPPWVQKRLGRLSLEE